MGDATILAIDLGTSGPKVALVTVVRMSLGSVLTQPIRLATITAVPK